MITEQPQPELEIVQVDNSKKEKDLAEESNIRSGYSEEAYERAVIYPTISNTLH
jgi:hypothetical protein